MKVPEEELRRFLCDATSDERRSVVIEIAVPEPQVELDPDSRRSARVSSLPAERWRTYATLVAATELLEKTLSRPSVEIRAAAAFAATATAAELLEVLQSPLIRAVRLNRKWSVVAKGYMDRRETPDQKGPG